MRANITKRKRGNISGKKRHGTADSGFSSGVHASVAGKRILIVDDDSDQLLMLEQLLTSKGYLVETVEKANTALSMLKESPVDCIISDVMMPEVSGEEFVSKLRDISGLDEIPVIMVTSGSGDSEMELIRCGADMLCLKQDMKKTLLRQLRLLLE